MCSNAFGEGIPVVTIEGENLSEWAGKKDVRDAMLWYRDLSTGTAFGSEITIRPQGTSSLGYEKKNFTIVLQGEGREMLPGWGKQNEYCLKANYIDPTHACNVVSARLAGEVNKACGLFPEAPNAGCVDGFPVWLILNGQDAGLYTWNIPKAEWLFGMDPENENHIVMCCEGWTEGCTFHSAAFRLEDEWSIEAGPETAATVEKFARLTSFIADSTNEEWMAAWDQYLNLDACINYMCFASIANAADNLGKNMLMVTYDGQIWQPALYDLDSLWGIGYDGMAFMEELIGTSTSCPRDNRLFERIWECFPEQVSLRYAELRGGILSTEHIRESFLAYTDAIPTGCYALDGQMWNADGRMIRTLDVMFDKLEEYLPMADAQYGYVEEKD